MGSGAGLLNSQSQARRLRRNCRSTLRHGHKKGIAGGDKKTGVVERDNTFIIMERLGASIDLPGNQEKRKKEEKKKTAAKCRLSA